MTKEQLGSSPSTAKKDTFVISRAEEGFRVYSPANPTRSYVVSGSPDSPACTCPEFQNGIVGERCRHILAVLNHSGWSVSNREEEEERLAIQNENQSPEDKSVVIRNDATPRMLIKRSVSPDGRIDSLSIECSFPVDHIPAGEIKVRAEKALRLQSEIIESFLNGNSDGEKGRHSDSGSNGPVSARMLAVGGMDGRWGRRLFINIQADGKTLKLFGTRKQLADHLTAAGFPDYADDVEEGKVLNLPCRVVTKPSDDGRFVNVDRILPIEPSTTTRAK
jgi:hypothetical protein